jgi:hypothetical protein
MSSVWHKLQQAQKREKAKETETLYSSKFKLLRKNQILSEAIYQLRRSEKRKVQEVEEQIPYYELLCDRCKKRIRSEARYEECKEDLENEISHWSGKMKRWRERKAELRNRGRTEWGKEVYDEILGMEEKKRKEALDARMAVESLRRKLDFLKSEMDRVESVISPSQVDEVYREFMEE